MNVTATIETITPARAAEMLASNTNNRPLRRAHVDSIARDMAAGNYPLNGEPIIIGRDGTILNGQHRLHACVKANVPFETLVVYGIERDAMVTMDSGAKRSLADQLRLSGHKNVKELASLISLAIRWGSGRDRFRYITNSEALLFMERNPEVKTAARFIHKTSKSPAKPNRAAIGAIALAGLHATNDELEVEQFVAMVCGDTADKDHPTYVLWKTMVGWASQRNVHRDSWLHLAMLIKCWNATVMGQPVRLYRRRADESFPTMLDEDGNAVELPR